MTFTPNTNRRGFLVDLGLVAALTALPGVASAQGPFFVDIAQPVPGHPAPRLGDVLDTAAAQGQFRTWLRLVRIAGYEDTLRGPGPFTVFAPTDDAFTHMTRAELDRLGQPSAHQDLLTLLSYHVTAGRLNSAALSGKTQRVHSANGQPLDLDGRDGLRVDNQLVVLPDLAARNGVVHGVNAVLTPPTLIAAAT